MLLLQCVSDSGRLMNKRWDVSVLQYNGGNYQFAGPLTLEFKARVVAGLIKYRPE